MKNPGHAVTTYDNVSLSKNVHQSDAYEWILEGYIFVHGSQIPRRSCPPPMTKEASPAAAEGEGVALTGVAAGVGEGVEEVATTESAPFLWRTFMSEEHHASLGGWGRLRACVRFFGQEETLETSGNGVKPYMDGTVTGNMLTFAPTALSCSRLRRRSEPYCILHQVCKISRVPLAR